MRQEISFAIVGILLAVSIGLLSLVLGNVVQDIRTTQQQLVLVGDELERTRSLFEALATENETLARVLAQEEEARAALLARQETQDATLATLSENLARISQADITRAVAEWEPHIFDITCTFASQNNGGGRNGGSATLQKTSAGTRFLSSSHIFQQDNMTLESCSLSRPDTTKTYTIPATGVTHDTTIDFAHGPVTQATDGFAQARTCTTVPQIGDPVLALGYPTIGSKESITATEGIISGIEETYYLSSAKIDKGHSGGAIIDLERDCFLGIPTLSVAGRVESIARILPLP